ncbi:MAG: type II secretion system protein [Candidatus Eremiobacteraeota bacterium]|nr:type II secretion system protein [Candidatus Eremiobacteraeota bacterium]
MVLRRRGFTLVELIVACAMLGVLIIALFQAFDYGSNAFQQATRRQDAQGQATRVYSSLRDELRQSHFWMASTVDRAVNVDDTEYDRDALVFGSLRDWSDEENFDHINGLPEWNRYMLYYGTQETDYGKLVRATLDPPWMDSDHSPAPFKEMEPERYLKDDPASNTGHQSSYRILTEDLLEFKASLDPALDIVTVRCVFEKERKGQKNRSEFEIKVFPQNTWPKGEQ